MKKFLHLITGSYHCSDNEEAANANQRPGLVCVSICRASWPWSLIGQSHCLPGSHWSREASWLTGDNNWQHLSEISNWVFEGWNSQLEPRQITHYQWILSVHGSEKESFFVKVISQSYFLKCYNGLSNKYKKQSLSNQVLTLSVSF